MRNVRPGQTVTVKLINLMDGAQEQLGQTATSNADYWAAANVHVLRHLAWFCATS